MVILASNSPRRKQLLALGGWSFTILAASIDEEPISGETPRDYVLRLAESKARATAALAPDGAVVLAADTTVVSDGVILGKPAGPEEAASMLRLLRGRTHEVFSGLAALRLSDGVLLADWCVTGVTMRVYTDEDISAYIATGDPLDKAGAYAIQHDGFHPVEKLTGCYTNVVGLPLCQVTRLLSQLGLDPDVHAPYACLYTQQEVCSISTDVLPEEA